jgi:hypothetical protein
MVYLIREDGCLRIETDHHILGLFSLHVWRDTLQEAEFQVHEERYCEGLQAYLMFACVKPG